MLWEHVVPKDKLLSQPQVMCTLKLCQVTIGYLVSSLANTILAHLLSLARQ